MAITNFRVAGFVLGLGIKAPVHTAAIVNIPSPNGVGGNINGYIVEEYDRVLLTAQTDPIDNGIYSVRRSAWVRDGDADGNRDFVGGTIVPVWNQALANIQLYRLAGDPDAKTVGVDALTFTVYYDPTSSGVEVDTLESVTARGNTTAQGMIGTLVDWEVQGGISMQIKDGGTLVVEHSAGVESVTVDVNDTITAPNRAVAFTTTANVFAYNFDEAVNIDGHLYIGQRRLAGYRIGDAVESSINFDGSQNIRFTALGDNEFIGDIVMLSGNDIEMRGYRIVQLQFSIITNSVTIDVNSTSAARVDIEEASANFNVVLTAPAEGNGYYCELNIDFSQGSTPYQPIWPASVLWPGGTAPTLSAANNAIDVVHVWTRDGGTTWHGSFLLDFS